MNKTKRNANQLTKNKSDKKYKYDVHNDDKQIELPPNLHKNGYFIIKNGCNELICDELIDNLKIELKKNKSIFNSRNNDRKRLQTTLKLNNINEILINFISKIKDIIKPFIGDNLYLSEWNVLKSKNACKEQIPHCDHIPSYQFIDSNDEDKPLSAIISIMDNSKIVLWDKSINYPDDILEKFEKKNNRIRKR